MLHFGSYQTLGYKIRRQKSERRLLQSFKVDYVCNVVVVVFRTYLLLYLELIYCYMVQCQHSILLTSTVKPARIRKTKIIIIMHKC